MARRRAVPRTAASACALAAALLLPVAAGGDGDRGGALPVPFSITVSGGVSLGAYEAGYLYYLTELAKRNPHLLDFRLVTGASAGTINALIAVIEMGRRPVAYPRDSLFYEAWTEVRYDELFDADRAPPLSLSSRRAMEEVADDLAEIWNRGLDRDLDVVMGAVATHLESNPIEIRDALSVPRQEERFVFRVRGRGPGRAPEIVNYVDPYHGLPQALLPFGEARRPDGESGSAFDVIRKVLYASSAFPVAFPPQEIGYCVTSPGATSEEIELAVRECPAPTHRALFVDGGVLDNNPLRLAHRIAGSGLVRGPGGALVWRPKPDLSAPALPDGFVLLYLDPDHTSYPMPSGKDDEDRALDLFPAFGVFARSFLESTEFREIVTLLEEHPEVRDRIETTSRDFPTASGQLLNFFGFFDREFRRYDFYLGMRDARRFADRVLLARLERAAGRRGLDLAYPEGGTSPKTPTTWQPYFCLRAYMDGRVDMRDACEPEALEDFRILAQVSIDRLYDHCRDLPYDETVSNLHCKRAMNGAEPPGVFGVRWEPDAWRREDGENRFEHTMRLLETYEFHFEDLGLDRDESKRAMSKIREEILGYVDALADKQPPSQKAALQIVGKPAVNFFKYAPPEDIVYLTAGNALELGWSGAWMPLEWIRSNLALQVQGIYQVLAAQQYVVSLTPAVGFEFEIVPMNSALFQLRFGLRAGYQLSTEDRFLSRACDGAAFLDDTTACSAPVGQGIIAASFYERIRLQVGVEWFPRWLPPMDEVDEHLWNVLIEIGWQWLSPF